MEPTVLDSETTAEVVIGTGPPTAPDPDPLDPLALELPPTAPPPLAPPVEDGEEMAVPVAEPEASPEAEEALSEPPLLPLQKVVP